MKTQPGFSFHAQQEHNDGALMSNYAKRTGMLILLGLIVVLGLVSAAAASAVWGG